MRSFKYFIVSLLISCTLFGCSKELEPYQQESQESAQEDSHSYMEPTTLWADDESFPCYVIEKNYVNDGEIASGSSAGITTIVSVHSAEESQEGLMEAASEEECTLIIANEGYHDVAFYDATNANGCYLRQISYSIEKDGSDYPCMVIIKEESFETAIMQTVVRVDNTDASEKSSEILQEVLETYGIELE